MTSLPTALIVLRGAGTIIDADRVLVLHSGVAGEFDHPHLLLQNPEGLFASLVSVSGVGPMGPGVGCRAASLALGGGTLVGAHSVFACTPSSRASPHSLWSQETGARTAATLKEAARAAFEISSAAASESVGEAM